MAAKSKPVEEVTVADLGLDPAQVGSGRRPPAGHLRRGGRGPQGRRDRRRRGRRARARDQLPRAAQGPLGGVAEVDKIWVLAEQRDGVPLGIVLELLTAARGFASSRRGVHLGSRRRRCGCRRSVEYGATKVYDVGDIGESLPGPEGRGRDRGPGRGREQPRRHLRRGRPTTAGTSPARLSVRLDRPVLTNIVGIDESDGDMTTEHAIFGGSMMLRARFTDGPPGIFVVRAKSFAAEPARGRRAGSRDRRRRRSESSETRRQRRCAGSSPATRRSAAGPSSTRRPSSCPAGGASARPRTTPSSPSSPSC